MSDKRKVVSRMIGWFYPKNLKFVRNEEDELASSWATTHESLLSRFFSFQLDSRTGVPFAADVVSSVASFVRPLGRNVAGADGPGN